MSTTIDLWSLEYDTLIHFTPTAEERRGFAKSGVAMPDGSFYIRNRNDLSNAILATGRATPNAGETADQRRNAVRRHIMKRARALKLGFMIPKNWNADGTLKQSSLDMMIDEFLAHFGVLGMRWGYRKSDGGGGGGRAGGGSRQGSAASPANHPSLNAPRPKISSDAATARTLQGYAKKRGPQNLSNLELQQLVTRQSLERQYSQLNPRHVSAGEKFIRDVGRDSSKQLATSFVVKFAPKGAAWVAKRAAKRLAVPMARTAAEALLV